MAQYISLFSPVLNPSMLTNAPSQPRNPSRRTASSANVPSRMETLPSARSSLARGEAGSRLRTRTEYFLSATRAWITGMPWAPVPPITKIFDVLCEDMSDTLDDGGVCHTAALTHRLQPVAGAALLER